ncbi:hypothetical protein ABUE29_26730, partial [Mesorhizobium sp. ZMM04-4]
LLFHRKCKGRIDRSAERQNRGMRLTYAILTPNGPKLHCSPIVSEDFWTMTGVVAGPARLEMLAHVLDACCKQMGVPDNAAQRQDIAVIILAHFERGIETEDELLAATLNDAATLRRAGPGNENAAGYEESFQTPTRHPA